MFVFLVFAFVMLAIMLVLFLLIILDFDCNRPSCRQIILHGAIILSIR